MLGRVIGQAQRTTGVSQVLVATDTEAIAHEAQRHGAQAVLTDPDLPSGTDRCWAALEETRLRPDYIVNLQGDEPFADPEHIRHLFDVLEGGAAMATLGSLTRDRGLIESAHTAKIVVDQEGYALYFSRYPIPYARAAGGIDVSPQVPPYVLHHGMYGFRYEALRAAVSLPLGKLERAESLEQLRWLEGGLRIRIVLVEGVALSVDTPADLERARALALSQPAMRPPFPGR